MAALARFHSLLSSPFVHCRSIEKDALCSFASFRPPGTQPWLQCMVPSLAGRGRGRGSGSGRGEGALGRLSSSNAPVMQLEEQWGLGQILDQMRLALGIMDCSPDAHYTVTGRQICFGLEGDWRLTWCLEGRFYEHYISSEMELEHGYDGQHSPWHADVAGRVSELELDHEEICLLAVWIRTGYWLTDEGIQKLIIQSEDSPHNENSAANKGLVLSVCIKGKKVLGHVLVDSTTWLPVMFEIKAFGGMERWEFTDWQCLMPGSFMFAKSTAYWPASGGRHLYSVSGNSIACSMHELSQDCLYSQPSTLVLPRHTANYPRVQFDNSCSSSVKMVRARSGQHLVCPMVDGRDIGYFIIDTGASGLVISRKKANEARMDAFGEAFGIGVEGKFRTRFRRGTCFQLGPLQIDFPLYMEAPSDEVVKQVTEGVSGVCGYDIFYNCVVEMCSIESRLSLYDPLLYRPKMQLTWEPFFMLDNVPHTRATLNGQSTLLMLDTGAGGVDIIFHHRAVQELNLLKSFDWKGSAEVGGLGPGDQGIKAQFGILSEVQFAGRSFSAIKALYFNGDEQTLDVSMYTAGVLCGDLILKQLAIFDYANHRYALVEL